MYCTVTKYVDLNSNTNLSVVEGYQFACWFKQNLNKLWVEYGVNRAHVSFARKRFILHLK
jgi:hypothetical protein